MRSLTPNPLTVIPVWDAMMQGARNWAQANGFTAVHGMPSVAGASGSCEQWESTFELRDGEDFFGKKAFLVQSGQLYLECLTPLFGKVYTEIQSFRKEREADARHLTQFTLFEIEHLGGLDELMRNIEAVVKASVRAAAPVVRHSNPERADELGEMLEVPFYHLTYTDAVDALAEFFPDLRWGDDLKADHEAKITQLTGVPTLLREFPTLLKFWNMEEITNSSETVKSCDLLLPFAGESAGAAARTTSYDDLVRRLRGSDMYRLMKESGVKDEEFDWYLDIHKTGEVAAHAGAGIGMARVAQYVLGTDDIREAVPFVLNRENLL